MDSRYGGSDLSQAAVMPTFMFVPALKHDYLMHCPAPFAHDPASRPQRDTSVVDRGLAGIQAPENSLDLPPRVGRKISENARLPLPRDSATQQVGANLRRWFTPAFPPLAPELSGRHAIKVF